MTEELADAEILAGLAEEEDDPDTRAEVAAELASTEADIAALEEESLYFGEYDDRPAVLSVHAGAGGVDAQDWAEMLLRMYTRCLDGLGFRSALEDRQPGEEAGIKSAALTA